MNKPLTCSLENVFICSLPNTVGQAWSVIKSVIPGHYVELDESFEMPGVGEVQLYLYQDLCGNFFVIHEEI